jgi:hypothetical protein
MDQPLAEATADVHANAGATSSNSYDQTDNGTANFVIQAQGDGDSDYASDEGYYRFVTSAHAILLELLIKTA